MANPVEHLPGGFLLPLVDIAKDAESSNDTTTKYMVMDFGDGTQNAIELTGSKVEEFIRDTLAFGYDDQRLVGVRIPNEEDPRNYEIFFVDDDQNLAAQEDDPLGGVIDRLKGGIVLGFQVGLISFVFYFFCKQCWSSDYTHSSSRVGF